MDYDSDLYYEHSDMKSPPAPPPPTAMAAGTKSTSKRPRNLEDRVREYTGYVEDEDLDGPIYYSTERSSDSTSPFLVARTTAATAGRVRPGGGGGGHQHDWRSTRTNTSPRYLQVIVIDG